MSFIETIHNYLDRSIPDKNLQGKEREIPLLDYIDKPEKSEDMVVVRSDVPENRKENVIRWAELQGYTKEIKIPNFNASIYCTPYRAERLEEARDEAYMTTPYSMSIDKRKMTNEEFATMYKHLDSAWQLFKAPEQSDEDREQYWVLHLKNMGNKNSLH